MNENKIIVITDPVSYFQRILALVDGKLVDQLGVSQDDLTETIDAFVAKYNATHIDVTGPKAYAMRYVQQLSDPTKYSNLTVNYCEMRGKTNGKVSN